MAALSLLISSMSSGMSLAILTTAFLYSSSKDIVSSLIRMRLRARMALGAGFEPARHMATGLAGQPLAWLGNPSMVRAAGFEPAC